MSVNRDLVYDLTGEETDLLTDGSLESVPLQSRLSVLNGVIHDDYDGVITVNMLEKRSMIDLPLRPSVLEELRLGGRQTPLGGQSLSDVPSSSLQDALPESGLLPTASVPSDAERDIARVDGALVYDSGRHGWFREGAHGREVSVGEIRVEPLAVPSGGTTYRMTAVINGESVTHEISARQYDRFMAVDDWHRMKLFSQIFHEVDLKALPMDGAGVGAGLLAAMAAAGGLMGAVADHRRGPELYMERSGRGHVYMKPGVDTASDIACRAFDAGINAAVHGTGIGR